VICCLIAESSSPLLAEIARACSPRVELHGDRAAVFDASGLRRVIGAPPEIAREVQALADEQRVRVRIAIAPTRVAAWLLAHGRPGITVIDKDKPRDALATLPVSLLACLPGILRIRGSLAKAAVEHARSRAVVQAVKNDAIATLSRWGLRTLGQVAALPRAEVRTRLGDEGVRLHQAACGEDAEPLVPAGDIAPFLERMVLEWPIEGLEPLSFVLTRLLEPLSTRLERRDRGAAVLHILLRLVTRDASGTGWEEHARRLQLPTPMRDVRTLRTLALLDLESHPPAAAIDRVRIVIDPTPGRVLQHTLFARAQPTPEQLSTLVARLGALMGQDRFGAPVVVDTYRPGAFAMTAFATEHTPETRQSEVGSQKSEGVDHAADFRLQTSSFSGVVSALRRCRYPVPARVVVAEGRPVRVTTDRRGFAGGAVTRCAGPWRTSGDWWAGLAGVPPVQPIPPILPHWNRDEWDVALNDGAVYRIFQDRVTDAWFIDAIVD